MNYVKPEVNLLSAAVAAIQNPSDKSEPETMDSDVPTFGSITAYASDE